jgi:hypothetical protein
VSLAGGLLVAAEGGKPDPAVWATGGWSEGGICRVDLGEKLGLAAEFGARQFFVPESQLEEAKQVLLSRNCDSVQLGALFEGTVEVRKALRDYLRELDVPPAFSDPRGDRAAYYLRQRDHEWARQYYRDNLLSEIAGELRRQCESLGGPSATHLVTIASDSPELVYMGLVAFQPARCLILYTRDKHAMLEQITSMCAQRRSACEVVPMAFESPDELLVQMGAAVEQFTLGADPESTVLDLTPGTKEMSMSLAFEVAKPGNRLIYLRHRRQGAKVVPFSEELRLWSAQLARKKPESLS